MKQGMSLRASMLEEIDDVYVSTDGETPDHLIVSEATWQMMEDENKFETLADKSNPKRPGYLGMRVWYSRALDERDKIGLLMSERAFRAMAPKAKDFNR